MQHRVGYGDTRRHRSSKVGVIERAAASAPTSGLGLFLGEAHEVLRELQALVLREETAEFVETASRCGACSARLATKDTKTLVYRTVFGKASLNSPRMYSRCVGCGAVACLGQTFSPLALALPERTCSSSVQSNWLIDYAKRRAPGRPISSAGAGSAVDCGVGQRMKRNGQMQWTQEGANELLQVRCAVLNGQDIRNFKRWYPPDERIHGLYTRAAA